MYGLALVDQHSKRGSSLPIRSHDHAWFTFPSAGSYIERLPGWDRPRSAGMVIWHPPDLVHGNCFVSDGHNLNLAFEPLWLESLPPDLSVPSRTHLWDGGLPYR